MTNNERIEKAREWRDIAIQRRDFTQKNLDENEETMVGPNITAHYNTLDSMQDRINLIEALFPELREEK